MQSKEFHLGAILSITTGYTLDIIESHPMDAIYNILNFMTNDDLFTHALPRAADECKPYLLEQFPFLVGIDPSQKPTEQSWHDYVNELCEQHGTYHQVMPIHFEDHDVIDPIEEAIQLKGGDESSVITIDVTDEDPPNPYGDINWKVDN